MTLIVDEVMLREPNLLVPGKKPVGPVKIDWSHSLSNGLKSFIVPLQINGAVDLVKGNLPTVLTSTWVARLQGQALENADPTSSLTDQVAYKDDPDYALGAYPFTVVWSGYLYSYPGAAAGLMARDSSFGAGLWGVYYSDTEFKWACYSSSFQVTGFSSFTDAQNLPKRVTVIITCDGVSKLNKYTNNIKYTVTDANLIPTGAGTHIFKFNQYGNTGNSDGIDGYTYHTGIWHRQLSDVECEQIYADPYQILIPA